MNNIKVNLSEVEGVHNTSTSPYEIWDSAVNSYEVWWTWFKAESFEEYRLEWNEDSVDIPKTLYETEVEATTIKIFWVWEYYKKEYYTPKYFQIMLDKIQREVDSKWISYEEALISEWFKEKKGMIV